MMKIGSYSPLIQLPILPMICTLSVDRVSECNGTSLALTCVVELFHMILLLLLSVPHGMSESVGVE